MKKIILIFLLKVFFFNTYAGTPLIPTEEIYPGLFSNVTPDMLNSSGNGNGGDIVLWNKNYQNPPAPKLLDFYEAEHLKGLKIDLGKETLSLNEKVEMMIKRLESKSRPWAHRLRVRFSTFFEEARFVTNVNLVNIDDSAHVIIPNHTHIAQIAIQNPSPFSSFDPRYIINKRLWDKLDTDHQAGLVMHELIYREVLGAGDSRFVRHFVALLASGEIERMSLAEYLSILESKAEYFQYSGLSVGKFDFYDTFAFLSGYGRVFNNDQLKISGVNLYSLDIKLINIQMKEGLFILDSFSEFDTVVENQNATFKNFIKLDKNLNVFGGELKYPIHLRLFGQSYAVNKYMYYRDGSMEEVIFPDGELLEYSVFHSQIMKPFSARNIGGISFFKNGLIRKLHAGDNHFEIDLDIQGKDFKFKSRSEASYAEFWENGNIKKLWAVAIDPKYSNQKLKYIKGGHVDFSHWKSSFFVMSFSEHESYIDGLEYLQEIKLY